MGSIENTIELISKMNNLVYENQKKVCEILESIKKSVEGSNKETYEYRVKAYQDTINKINEHTMQIHKHREAIISTFDVVKMNKIAGLEE